LKNQKKEEQTETIEEQIGKTPNKTIEEETVEVQRERIEKLTG
jgi:hypothetical protein